MSKPDTITKTTPTEPPDISAELFDPEQEQALNDVLDGVFPGHPTRARASAKILTLLASGMLWPDVAKEADISWPEWAGTMSRFPVVQRMCTAARACGETVRQLTREAALHKRGTVGWKEPVYWRGEICGEITRFSDRCLELALRAADPDKYADRRQGNADTQGQVVINLIGVSPADCPPSPPPRTYAAPPAKSATMP